MSESTTLSELSFPPPGTKTNPTDPSIRRRRIIKIILALLILIGLVWVCRLGVIFAFAFSNARVLARSGQEGVERETAAARDLVKQYYELRSSTGFVVAIGPLLGWVPGFGAELASMPQLVTLADRIADAALPTLELYVLINDKAKSSSPGAGILLTAKSNPELISRASEGVEKARAARLMVDDANFSPEGKSLLEDLDDTLNAWTGALALVQHAPSLFGDDAQRNYLLLAQNSDEIRGSGGFISGAGILAVKKGDIAIKDFGDAYKVDNLRVAHPPPPGALQKYMSAPQWFIRDVGWYPNFPTTADVARSIYKLDRGVNPDGVIAVDLRFVPILLNAFPNAKLDGVAITPENVISEVKASWSPPPTGPVPADWWKNRKDFMGVLFTTLMGRIKGGQFGRTDLVHALYDGLRSHSIQLYFADPDVQDIVEKANWAGAVSPGQGDYLEVVDSNLGYNKVNAIVTRAMTYTVALEPKGSRATVDLAYKNPALKTGEACDHRPYYGKDYDDLEQRCYWNYVRVLAPSDSQLSRTQGVQDGGVADDVTNVAVFQGFLLVDRGETGVVQFSYRLPTSIWQDHVYSLKLQKQAGTNGSPVRVRVQLPEGWDAGPTSQPIVRRSGNTLEFDLWLDRDQTLTVNLVQGSRSFPMVPIIVGGALLLGGAALLLLYKRKANQPSAKTSNT